MKNDDLRGRLNDEISAAVNYADTQFAHDRIQAQRAYLGKPFNKVPSGRSAVISTDVSDTVHYLLPSLLETFYRGQEIVRFVPRNADDVAKADAATALVNHIFASQNDGFTVLSDFITDGLLFKAGVLKVYYEDNSVEEVETFEADDAQLAALLDGGFDIIESEVDETTGLTSVKVRKITPKPKICIDVIPPETFLFSPQATSVMDASFLAHRTYMTVGELVAMGYDRETVEEHAGLGEGWSEEETDTRHEEIDGGKDLEPRYSSMVRVVEAYMPIDDGDVEQRHRVLAIGDSNHILEAEPIDFCPFIVGSPIRVPHRMVGRSVAELVMDIQKIKSGLLRGVLDNMNLSNHARVAVVDQAVNLDDLMNSRPDGIVRMQQPGMVQPLQVPQVMSQGLSVLTYMDDVRDTRTGFSRASMGLDPDQLQSTTKEAVNATLQGGQIKVQMIARTLAETAIRPLARLILDLALKYYDQPLLLKIGDSWQSVDPASIDAELDVEIDVGIGSGRDTEKQMALSQIASIQKEILQTMGVQNPVVSVERYLGTLRKLASMSGLKDVNAFFASNDEIAQARQQMQDQPPAPDPEAQKAQQDYELQKSKQEAELALAREKMTAELNLRREEMAMEFELRRIEAQSGADISANLPRGQ
jgi:hypothetical protein